MTTPVIRSFVLGDFQTNCFVVTVPPSPRCWLVDVGYEPESMLDAVAADGLEPVAILLTHAHADHIAGLDLARSRFGHDLPVHLHERERWFCSDPMLNLSAFLGLNLSVAEPTCWLAGGETLELEGTRWRTLHAPGHSPGCTCFIHDDSKQAIVGDTLFAGSIGRVDFPTSSVEDMKVTVRQTMMALDDDLVIHPGHGPSTTIGHERTSNPFVLDDAW